MAVQKFTLGQVVTTQGVIGLLEENQLPQTRLSELLTRHISGDWGNVPKEDKELNDSSLDHGGRLMSSYTVANQTIWIITEWDRSYTTLMLPSEY